jgi:hypothetical protein
MQFQRLVLAVLVISSSVSASRWIQQAYKNIKILITKLTEVLPEE